MCMYRAMCVTIEATYMWQHIRPLPVKGCLCTNNTHVHTLYMHIALNGPKMKVTLKAFSKYVPHNVMRTQVASLPAAVALD